MNVRMTSSIALFAGAFTILLAACTPIQPQATVPDLQTAAITASEIGDTVAVLVVDYFDVGNSVAPEDIAGNCVTDVTEQIFWITWVVGEDYLNEEGVAVPKETVSHGDLVYTELAGQTGGDSQLAPDTVLASTNQEMIFHKDDATLLVRRVPIPYHTTEAVASGIEAAIEELRAKGVEKFVINLSLILLPCVPTVESLDVPISAEERFELGIAAINSLPPIVIEDEQVPSPYAYQLSIALMDSLNSLDIPILNEQIHGGFPVNPGANLTEPDLLVDPTPAYILLEDLTVVEDFTITPVYDIPVGIDPSFAESTGTTAEVIDALQVIDSPESGSVAIDLTGGVPALSYPADPVFYPPVGDLLRVPIFLPSAPATDTPLVELAPIVDTFAPVLAQRFLSWTISITSPTQALSLTTEIDTSPSLIGLRLSEEYTERDRLCLNLTKAVEESQALRDYCSRLSYGVEINDPGSELVVNDPLYLLLNRLHSEQGIEVVTVAAAGNLGLPYPFAPASWPNVISVGAFQNPFFVANAAEVQLPGVRSLGKIIRSNEDQITLTSTITIVGTSFAAPQLSLLVAKYMLDGNPFACEGEAGQTRPPLNYSDWDATVPFYGNWGNLSLEDARNRYCVGFKTE